MPDAQAAEFRGTIEEFEARFRSMQDEAKTYGIATVVLLAENDMFSDTMQIMGGIRGGYYVCLGMVTAWIQKQAQTNSFDND
jgi:hypothetical protein